MPAIRILNCLAYIGFKGLDVDSEIQQLFQIYIRRAGRYGNYIQSGVFTHRNLRCLFAEGLCSFINKRDEF